MHVESADPGEVARLAPARNGRGLSCSVRADRNHRVELRGALRLAGRSAVELATEPRLGAPPAPGQAAASSLRGRLGLPLPARPGPRSGALAHPGFGLGARASEYLSARTDRDRQELPGLRPGREGLPGWVHGRSEEHTSELQS